MLTWHTTKEVLKRWVHLYLRIRMVAQHPQPTHPCISNNQPNPQCPIYQQLTKDLILKFTCRFKRKLHLYLNTPRFMIMSPSQLRRSKLNSFGQIPLTSPTFLLESKHELSSSMCDKGASKFPRVARSQGKTCVEGKSKTCINKT